MQHQERHSPVAASRRRIVMRMVLGFARYNARPRSEPLPTIFTFESEALPGGGATAKPGTLRPMTRFCPKATARATYEELAAFLTPTMSKSRARKPIAPVKVR
jgi:hypothetical protein